MLFTAVTKFHNCIILTRLLIMKEYYILCKKNYLLYLLILETFSKIHIYYVSDCQFFSYRVTIHQLYSHRFNEKKNKIYI